MDADHYKAVKRIAKQQAKAQQEARRQAMAKVPKPRSGGQTGGGGRINQSGNRNASRARGGSPTRGGGGTGKKPGGCCSYTRAVKAITRLEFRLAARYVRMDVKARLGLIGSHRLGTIG